MNYSIHTFELRLTILPYEISNIRDWLYSKHIPIKEGDRYLSILQYSESGIRIRFFQDSYKPHFKFIVNLREVLETGNLVDLIDKDNFDWALDKAYEMISGFLEGKYNTYHLKLCRIDLCANIDVGSQEAVDTYLRLLNYKSGSRNGYKIQNINSPNGYCKNEFRAENKREGIAVSIYNKKAQLLDIRREKEAERAEGILRVEVQLKRRSTVKQFFPGSSINVAVKRAFLHSRETIAYILDKAITLGYYYKLSDAIELVTTNVSKKKCGSVWCVC